MSDEHAQEPSPEVRAQAVEMGWVDKPDFKGPVEKWVDAGTFVEKGEQILPIVQANNRRLMEANRLLEGRVNSLAQTVAASQEAMQALEEFHSEETERKVKEARARVVADLAAAHEAGDHASAATLTGELTKIDTKSAAAAVEKETPAPAAAPIDYTKDPAFIAFRQAHPWYGDGTTPENRRKTSLANAISAELRSDPANAGLIGGPFLEKVAQEVESTLRGAVRGGESRVGESRPNGNGGGSGSAVKTYADLPTDAKAACDKFAGKLVGEGRLHKNIESWRKSYVAKYFQE